MLPFPWFLDHFALENVLKSDFLTQGPKVEKFEKSLNKYFKSKYCSVVSNGTAALHLIGKALKWKKGDFESMKDEVKLRFILNGSKVYSFTFCD